MISQVGSLTPDRTKKIRGQEKLAKSFLEEVRENIWGRVSHKILALIFLIEEDLLSFSSKEI